jgi:hypothetical protein
VATRFPSFFLSREESKIEGITNSKSIRPNLSNPQLIVNSKAFNKIYLTSQQFTFMTYQMSQFCCTLLFIMIIKLCSMIDLTKKYPDFSNIDNKSNYKNNKINAVSFANYLLNFKYNDNNILEIIKKEKKKDDICDALLMIFYYYEK